MPVETTTLTLEEFNAQKATLRCGRCGWVGLSTEYNANNNGHLVVCLNPHCSKRKFPLGSLLYLRQRATGQRRKEYPPGNTVTEVWERFGNMCVVCSLPKSDLEFIGIGLQRHHPTEYVKSGHSGPILPVCVACHEFVTARQREARRWYRRLREVYGQLPPDSGAGVPTPRLPSDPLRSSGETPVGVLEGLSDHDADD